MSSLRLMVVVAGLAFASGQACDDKQIPRQKSAANAGEPFEWDGKRIGDNCKARSERLFFERRRMTGMPPTPVAYAGDGALRFCLGDSLDKEAQEDCREQDGVVRCRDGVHSMDRIYKDGKLARIRIHHRGRFNQRLRNHPFAYTTEKKITLGSLVSEALKLDPSPLRVERRQDPEFGNLDVYIYDGIELEGESRPDGSIIGAINIVHSRTQPVLK